MELTYNINCLKFIVSEILQVVLFILMYMYQIIFYKYFYCAMSCVFVYAREDFF